MMADSYDSERLRGMGDERMADMQYASWLIDGRCK